MSQPSFAAAWRRYQEDLYEWGRRPVTVRCYQGILRDFAGSLTVPWQQATPRDLRRFLDMPSPGSRTGRLAAATRQQYITAIRGFYRWAHLNGLLASDPMRAVALPRAGQPIPRALPLADVRTILLAATGDQRLLVLLWLAFGAGLRSGEIARCQIEDLQLHASPPLLAVPHGKGGRGRLVPLAAPVVEILRGWLVGRPSRGPLVESRTWPGQPLSPHEVSRQMAAHIHALGIDATGHALRHTYATELLRAGKGTNLYAVSRALGHTDTRITSSVYVSSYVGELGELAALLPDPRIGNGGVPRAPRTGLAAMVPVDE